MGENGSSAALQAALAKAEARKAELEAELAVAEAPAPRLMPNLAELYRAKIESLREALDRRTRDRFTSGSGRCSRKSV